MSCCNPRNTPNRHMRRGPRGESAYEFWKSKQPEGADTSECAFLEYMKGTKGDDGQSFYEWWVSKQPEGADTSDEAFMNAMKGKGIESIEMDSEKIAGGTQLKFVITLDGGEATTMFVTIPDGEPGKDGAGLEKASTTTTAVAGGTKVDIHLQVEGQAEEVKSFTVLDGAPGTEGASLVKATTTTAPVEGGTKVDIHLQIDGEAEEVKSFTVLNGEPGKDGGVADFDQNQFTTKTVGGKEVVTIKNDPDESNQLSVIGGDGLFARPASAQVRAKDKSVRVAGIPQAANGGFNTEVSANIIPVKNNQLGITTKGTIEGLYVPPAHEELLSPNNTLTITTSSTEVPFEPAMTDIDVAISQADGNTIEVKEDGLFAAGGGGGDLDSKYIKVGEATAKPEAAVGGGDGTIVIGSGAGNGLMDPADKATVVGALSKSLSEGGAVFGYNCSATGKQGIAIGFETTAQGDNTVSIGNTAAASQRGGIAIGWNTQSLDDDGIAIGRNAKVNGNSSIVIGVGANTAAQNVILLGTNANATGNNGMAIGQNAKSVFNAIVIGPLAEASGGNSTLIGYGTKAAQAGTAVGHSAHALVGNSAALGVSAHAEHDGSVAIGFESVTDREDSVSVGTPTSLRQITNVANATERTDAVNWGQTQDLIQVKELNSTAANPVNLNSLSGPMTYRIREGDYNAETNPNPFTIVNAPHFGDRSATIEVYIHTDGILQECKTPDQKYTRMKGVAGRRGAWGVVTNDKTAPSYYFGGVGGYYWESDTGIFTKNSETIVIGTPEEPVNTMFVPFINPLAPSTGNGVLTGISHAYGYNGKVKLFLQRRTGTPSGDAPRDDELFNYAMVSDARKNASDNVLEFLSSSATTEEIIDRINKLIELMGDAGIANTIAGA